MCSKQNEIEAVVEDLIENVILEALAGTLSDAKECELAIDLLREKLDDLDPKTIQAFFE